MNVVRSTLLLTGLLLFSAGCEQPPPEWVTVGPGSRQGDVSLYRDVQFADIPIPAEYDLRRDLSYSFQGAVFRNAVLVYEGYLDWSAALEFYRRELPNHGWNLSKTERGHDFRVLYFDKGEEKLIAIVKQTRGGSQVEIQLDNVDKNDLLLKGRLNNPGY